MGSLTDRGLRAFQLRSLVAEDYGACLLLWARCGRAVERTWEDPTLPMKLLERNPLICCVAEHDDRLIGALLCGHDGALACMHHVAVEDAWRRLGVGSALIAWAIEELGKAGIQRVHAIADSSSGNSWQFMRACGWRSQEDLAFLSIDIPVRRHS